MTKEVLIHIRGLHTSPEAPDEDIEVIFPGTCKLVQDTWCLTYSEPIEGTDGEIKNLIKLKNDGSGADVVKRGLVDTNMTFMKGRKTQTWYQTPFGGVQLDIMTTGLDYKETETQISADIFYVLQLGEQHMTDCKINILVTGKEAGIQ